MNHNRTVALIGAALIFVGVFVPIVSLPIMGSINFFMNGRGDGTILIALALAAAGLALAGRVRDVVWPGAASLIFLGYAFLRFRSGMADAREKLERAVGDSPFRGLAEAAMGSVQLQWGWAVLLVGGALVTWAGIAERRARRGHKSADPTGSGGAE